MKKLFGILLFTAILMLLSSLYVSAATYDTIKVGLYFGNSAKSSVTISASGGISCGTFANGAHSERVVYNADSITVGVADNHTLSVNNAEFIDVTGSNISLAPISGYISVNGTPYRGVIVLQTASSTAMTVINALPLEEYLYGVIAGEMPALWNAEALKAQTVCARGFAVSNFNKHSSYGFNVCTTTECQVYKGVNGEHPASNAAVDATRGMLLKYNGAIAETLFFSQSGGHTANSKNVWGSAVPYLCGVPDPYESPNAPLHTWSATLTLEQITSALSARGVNVGSVTSLTANTDETGRVYELIINGTGGTYTLKRQSTFTSFSSYGVKSQKYTLIPLTDSAPTAYAATSYGTYTLGGTYAITSGGVANVATGNYTMLSSSGYSTQQSGNITGYTFSGGGYGHGVGMSQYGAQGMASNGFTYDQILLHYYPGTYLESY